MKIRKITFDSLEEEVRAILKDSEPLLKLKDLADEIHKRICFLNQRISAFYDNCKDEDLMYCKTHGCDECGMGKCPQIKSNISNLKWGPKSLSDIIRVIGEWSYDAYGKLKFDKDGNEIIEE